MKRMKPVTSEHVQILVAAALYRAERLGLTKITDKAVCVVQHLEGHGVLFREESRVPTPEL